MSHSHTIRPALPAAGFRNAWMLWVLVAAGLLQAGPSPAAERIRVAVSILPHAEFVERLAGDRAEVEVMVGPGQSPHTYDPTSRQWARLSGTAVYFATGVEMENLLLPRIRRAFPDIRIVDTTEGLQFLTMGGEPVSHLHERVGDPAAGGPAGGDGDPHSSGHVHVHGEDCDHAPGSVDPHVWLSPRNAKIQAGLMAEALMQADPEHASAYAANLERFLEDLDAVDAELAETLAPMAGTSIFVFHPAFGYLASAYGMTQTAIERDGLDPGTRYLTEVIERGRRMGVAAIFVSPQFSAASARMVAREIGAEVVVIDPLARDYVDNLRSVARTIRESLHR